MSVYEVNFDGLVGPTHNYAGLSPGNLHSISNKDNPSNPKKAALQGLDKMKLMHDLGYKQAIIPPQERPLVDDYEDYYFDPQAVYLGWSWNLIVIWQTGYRAWRQFFVLFGHFIRLFFSI